jgi:hypothetical protein
MMGYPSPTFQIRRLEWQILHGSAHSARHSGLQDVRRYMSMLRALSVIPVEALAEQLAARVREIPELRLVRTSASYPSLEAVLQAIRVDRPDFLFVHVSDLTQLESFLMAIDDLACASF